MKLKCTLIFLVFFILNTNTTNAQRPVKLRSFGIGILGEYGFTQPAGLSAGSGMSSIRTFSRRDAKYKDLTWHNVVDGRSKDKMDFSYSIGLSLFYMQDVANFNLLTIEGGYKQTKLVHYYILDQPLFVSQFEGANNIQDWFYMNQFFLNLKYSIPISSSRKLFLYVKGGGTYSQGVTKSYIPQSNTNLYNGFSSTEPYYWNSTQSSSMTINHATNDEGVFGVMGGLGLNFSFGKLRQLMLFGGVVYYYNFDSFSESQYIRTDNTIGLTESVADVSYNGNYVGYELGFKFPLIRNRLKKRERGNEEGSISIEIVPYGAIASGAKWRVGNSSWMNSGDVAKLAPGKYLVTFSAVSGWVEPSAFYVNIIKGNKMSRQIAYDQYMQPPPQKGNLMVDISPRDAVLDNAQWKISGHSWKDSGETIYDLKEGNYTIVYRSLNGWISPSQKNVFVRANKTEKVSAYYKEDNTDSSNGVDPKVAQYMVSCFKDKKSKATYYEDDLRVTNGKVEIELYPTNGEDGDRYSICLDGDVKISNEELTDEGKKISVDMSGRSESIMIIKILDTGKDNQVYLDFQVLEGSVQGTGLSGQKGQLQLQNGTYYYFKIVK